MGIFAAFDVAVTVYSRMLPQCNNEAVHQYRVIQINLGQRHAEFIRPSAMLGAPMRRL